MKITKVVTHAGVFHLDEILAIATLRELGVVSNDTPIERKFQVTEDELNNSSVIIVDVGKNYNPELNNFDHHQEVDLPASNVLVFNSFYSFGYGERNILLKKLFYPVSDNDRGLNVAKEDDASLYSAIRNFNNLDNGFEGALQFVQQVLSAYIATAKKAVEGEKRWNELENKKTNSEYFYKIQKDDNFIPNWKELAINDNVHFLITPNARKGWQIITRDSDEIIFPESSDAIFRHPSGFMIVFSTIEEIEEFLNNNF